MSNKSEVSLLELYEAGSNAVLHYSKLIWQTRVITLAQGFIILGGYLTVIKDFQDDFFLHLLTCAVGILFSLIMRSLQRNYMTDYRNHLSQVCIIEQQYPLVDSLSGVQITPWQVHKERHEASRRKFAFKVFVVEGPYFFFIVCYCGLLLFKIIEHCGASQVVDILPQCVC